MITKILVPIDGSRISRKAAVYAVDFAKQTGASVFLLSVIDKRFVVSQSIPSADSPTHIADPVEDYLRQAAEAYTTEIEGLCKKNKVPSKTLIKSGHPVEKIVKEAEKLKADLIIMGSRGNSALKAAIIGSITLGVLNKTAKIPVLVIR